MITDNREGLEQILSKLQEATLEAEPGSEEMENLLKQIGVITDKITALDKLDLDTELKDREVSIKEKNSSPIFDKALRVAEVVLVPVGVVVIDKTFTTAWTKMVCRWEKDETFRSSAGRAVSGLFKFKK